MRFADFSFFSIWFSVSLKNASGFSVLVPDVVFGFSYFFFLFGNKFRCKVKREACSSLEQVPAVM